MHSDTLFTGVRIVADGIDLHGDLLVRDGAIADFGPSLGCPDGARIVHEDGAVLCPGLIDIRVALGEPGFEYRETIASACAAASAGGITTLAALPDSEPAIDDPALVHLLITRGIETGAVTILPYGAATKGCRGEELAELGLLREAGAVAFTDGTRAVASSGLMRLALAIPPGSRARKSCSIRGIRRWRAWRQCDRGRTRRAVGLTRDPGGGRGDPDRARHQSREVDRWGGAFRARFDQRRAGPDTPRESGWAGGDLRYRTALLRSERERDWRLSHLRRRVSPPLRRRMIGALCSPGLADGTIDAVASDHQPRDVDDKRLPFAQASAGGVGLATLLAVTLAHVHNGELTLNAAIALLTSRPAALLGVDAGRIAWWRGG